jgi:uncharacterized protein with GYD domain
MPKFMFHGSYTAVGSVGVLKEGGMGRAAALDELMRSLGGSIVSHYWSFGGDDFFVVAELPDPSAAVVANLAFNASGAVNVSMTQLLSAAELDEAVGRAGAVAHYRPPGQ